MNINVNTMNLHATTMRRYVYGSAKILLLNLDRFRSSHVLQFEIRIKYILNIITNFI